MPSDHLCRSDRTDIEYLLFLHERGEILARRRMLQQKAPPAKSEKKRLSEISKPERPEKKKKENKRIP